MPSRPSSVNSILATRRETSTVERLREIARAIVIESPHSYRFAGRALTIDGHMSNRPITPLASPVGSPPPAQSPTPANPLVTQLTQTLYQFCYCERFDGILREPVVPNFPTAAEQAEFTASLSRGNAGQERWDLGWQVISMLPSGQILAQKGDTLCALWAGEFVTEGSAGMPPTPGARVRVYLPSESWTMQPGYYYALGTTATDEQDDRDLIRVYWNITAEGAPTLIHALTHTLNRFAVPFRFKCLTNPNGYTRIDGTVLFISRRYYHLTAELILSDILPNVAAHLKAETPIFTKQLAAGLSVAEDPGNGESFGMHRCRLIAEGVWAAFEQQGSVPDETQRFAAIANRFATDGLNIEHPHLNPGSRDVYTFDIIGSNAYAA